MNQRPTADDFYESKGLVRHSVFIRQDTREVLKSKAKALKISQGDLIDLLMTHIDSCLSVCSDDLSALQLAKEEERKNANEARSAAYKSKVVIDKNDLSPAALAEIERLQNKGA